MVDRKAAQRPRSEPQASGGGPLQGKAAQRPRSEPLLSKGRLRGIQRDVLAWRRGLHQDLVALGRSLADRASEYGEVQLPAYADRVFAESAELASRGAERLEAIAREAERLGGASESDDG